MPVILEPWEIELRKVLNGGKYKKDHHHNCLSKRKKKNLFNFYFFANIFLFLILIALMYFSVEKYKSLGVNEERLPEKNIPNNISNIFSEKKSDLDAVKEKINVINEKQKQLEVNLSTVKNRVVLFGALHNENWSILKDGKDKKDLIFVNEDWTINGLPKYILISDEDRLFLEKYFIAK